MDPYKLYTLTASPTSEITAIWKELNLPNCAMLYEIEDELNHLFITRKYVQVDASGAIMFRWPVRDGSSRDKDPLRVQDPLESRSSRDKDPLRVQDASPGLESRSFIIASPSAFTKWFFTGVQEVASPYARPSTPRGEITEQPPIDVDKIIAEFDVADI
jgi:hypothetical protein